MMQTGTEPISTKDVLLVESNGNALGLPLVNVRQTNKMNDCTDLVELAKHIQTADSCVRANVSNKLMIIADQIRYLQEQAKKIYSSYENKGALGGESPRARPLVLMDAKRDYDLNHAACNLVKKPGSTYYLYRKSTGQCYFSILSPEEWGTSCPHDFQGAYRPEHDMSWTPSEQLEKRKRDNALVEAILDTSQFKLPDAATFEKLNPSPLNCDASAS